MAIKQPSKRRRTAAELASDARQSDGWGAGPAIPKMRPGLPATDVESLHDLVLAIIKQGVWDRDEDPEFLMSSWFRHLLMYVGIEPDLALRIQCHILLGDYDRGAFKDSVLNAPRNLPLGDFGTYPTYWDSWSRA